MGDEGVCPDGRQSNSNHWPASASGWEGSKLDWRRLAGDPTGTFQTGVLLDKEVYFHEAGTPGALLMPDWLVALEPLIHVHCPLLNFQRSLL
jgi:hypothetical protein